MTVPRMPLVALPDWERAVSRTGGQCETNAYDLGKRCGARLRLGDRLFLGPDGVLRCEPCDKRAERTRTRAKSAQARAELAATQESLF